MLGPSLPGESRCSQSFRCKHLRKTVQNISGRVWGSIVSDTAIKDQQIPRPRLPADCQVNQAVTTLNGSWLGDSQIQACMRLAVGLRVHSARAHGARVGICHVTKLTLLEGHGNDHDAWPRQSTNGWSNLMFAMDPSLDRPKVSLFKQEREG